MEIKELLAGLLLIIKSNIILCGNIAVVIALACCNLSVKQKQTAILMGAGAIILQVYLTIILVSLFKIPYLHTIGGLFLGWLLIKLLVEDRNNNSEVSGDMTKETRMIIIAILIMSMGNTPAVAAASNGNLLLLIIGLALCMPIIIVSSKIIVWLMQRIPVLVYTGAGFIAWKAGEMAVNDVNQYVPQDLVWILPAVMVLFVTGYSWYKNRKKSRRVVESPAVE